MKPALHFVGFKGDEYTTAVRIWGQPDFIHPKWDRRAQIDIVFDDIAIFAQGDINQPISKYNAQDLVPQDPDNGV
jgi:hypothetical protein